MGLEDIVSKEVSLLGYELVELRRGGPGSSPIVEIRIDRLDGGAVTVNDCASVSRALEPRLEESGLVAANYVLQVSSPGERRLRGAGDWRRFVGRWVSAVSPEHGGRFEERLVAVEGDEGSEVVVLESKKGGLRRIPLAAIREARLAFHW